MTTINLREIIMPIIENPLSQWIITAICLTLESIWFVITNPIKTIILLRLLIIIIIENLWFLIWNPLIVLIVIKNIFFYIGDIVLENIVIIGSIILDFICSGNNDNLIVWIFIFLGLLCAYYSKNILD